MTRLTNELILEVNGLKALTNRLVSLISMIYPALNNKNQNALTYISQDTERGPICSLYCAKIMCRILPHPWPVINNNDG
jgi:hypothetical protein